MVEHHKPISTLTDLANSGDNVAGPGLLAPGIDISDPIDESGELNFVSPNEISQHRKILVCVQNPPPP